MKQNFLTADDAEGAEEFIRVLGVIRGLFFRKERVNRL